MTTTLNPHFFWLSQVLFPSFSNTPSFSIPMDGWFHMSQIGSISLLTHEFEWNFIDRYLNSLDFFMNGDKFLFIYYIH